VLVESWRAGLSAFKGQCQPTAVCQRSLTPQAAEGRRWRAGQHTKDTAAWGCRCGCGACCPRHVSGRKLGTHRRGKDRLEHACTPQGLRSESASQCAGPVARSCPVIRVSSGIEAGGWREVGGLGAHCKQAAAAPCASLCPSAGPALLSSRLPSLLAARCGSKGRGLGRQER
jgi:hypothetical protein